jgi:ascorbate-specific PTS system EIIC-type component UlaA
LTLKRFFKDNIVAMKITMGVFFLTMALFMLMEGV